MTVKLSINANLINCWDDFHDIFSKTLGFPGFYGRNMNAWIDCMSYIDDKDAGMTNIWINKGDTLLIELNNHDKFKTKYADIYFALLDCTAFVNARRVADNGPFIVISTA